MPVAAATKGPMGWFSTHRGGAAVTVLIGIAAAVALLFYFRSDLRSRTGDRGGGGLTGVVQSVQQAGKNAAQTVAELFSARSPGERASGVLASLKGKKRVFHARALPKLRRPAAPPSAYPYVAGPPPPTVVPPAGTPVFNTVTAAPPVAVAATTVPGGPNSPPIFPALPPPPGGGFVAPPPIVETPGTPGTPDTPGVPAVPEPASWAMMLVGFALVGGMFRRRGRTLTGTQLPGS